MTPVVTDRWQRTRTLIMLPDASSLAVDFHGKLSEEQLARIEELAVEFYKELIGVSGYISLIQMGPEQNMDRLPK